MKKFKVVFEGYAYGKQESIVCAENAADAYQIIVNDNCGDVHSIYSIEEVRVTYEN